jgi:hypothetical protein
MARQAVDTMWCALAALAVAALSAAAQAQDTAKSAAAARAQQERLRGLEEQVRTQQERVRALEYEVADERRRADAIIAHANRRITDAAAASERNVRQISIDLEQLRHTYQTETAALQSIVETAAGRASAAERERWIWGAAALLVGLGVGAFAHRVRRPERPLAPGPDASGAAAAPVVDQPDLFRAIETDGLQATTVR